MAKPNRTAARLRFVKKTASKRSTRPKSNPSSTSPAQILQEIRDVAPDSVLREIHRRLEIAGAIAYICAETLTAEACNEQDVALVLRRCVGDEIDRQMEEIDRLLGRKRTFASDEDAGGKV